MSNILVLEDNADLARMIQDILKWRGHQVMYARSGVEGLDALNNTDTLPDLIICDLIMPEMGGREFLDHVHANSAWSGIPFIVMSANGAEDDQEFAEKSGARGYLSKPFGLRDLDSLLTSVNL